MNTKLSGLSILTIGFLVTSCAAASTPITLYADNALAVAKVEDGLGQEEEWQRMIESGHLRFQMPYMMETTMMSDFQNEWVVIRAGLDLLRETQQIQNHTRIRMMMEASILKAFADVIDEEAIVLSDAIQNQLNEARTLLANEKATLVDQQDELRPLLNSLRSQMRSANRPFLWNATLISDITTSIDAIIPRLEAVTQTLIRIQVKISEMVSVLDTVIPSGLNPLTSTQEQQLQIFSNRLDTILELQTAIREQRLINRAAIQDIRELVQTMRGNRQMLTTNQRNQLNQRRSEMQSLTEGLRGNHQTQLDTLQSLRGSFNFSNLATVNNRLMSLINSLESSLESLIQLNDVLAESTTILEA